MNNINTDLLERVLDPENMNRAWKRVRVNKGAEGVDGVTIDAFPDWMRVHWPDIRQAIREGTYSPSPVRRVEIPKASGGVRLLGIPTVVDRVIQQAIAQVLSPMWEPEFSESSFGFRPQRSAHGAVKQVKSYINEGRKWAVDIDLAKFFDTVDHRIVLGRLARKLSGDPVLRLISRILRAGVEVNGAIEPSRCGVPQGGPLSPLLGNIVLDDLDKHLESKGAKFARYADDFVILVGSRKAGERMMTHVTAYLERRLKLTVNTEKSRVLRCTKLEYLGFMFWAGRIRVSPASLREFRFRLKRLTGRNWFVSMDYRLAKLRLYVRGWMNYYGLSEPHSHWQDLARWVFRRLRLCYWVMWKRPRTRIGNLLKLTDDPRTAIGLGRSSVGPWKASRMLGLILTNEWLMEQGATHLVQEWERCAQLR
jgi:RNA-directed DNA polymerase